ncbi:MAG: flagellar basal body L-ring protein FlgH, partial [Azonexus sp.]|nr:flagellar basal body L-ring protein FlgH [Azonexus sp.]
MRFIPRLPALFATLLVIVGIAGIAGCASPGTVPPSNVHQPMTARPEPRSQMPAANGAIYNVASSRPLFEDRRARFVGDTLIINIAEKTSASKNSENKAT